MNFPSPRAFARPIAIGAILLLTLTACKKLDQVDVPTNSPNPPVSIPSPGPAVSVVPGQGTTPTPAPQSTPAPSPSPGATATPSSANCSLAPLPDGSPCRAEAPAFQAQVETAQAEVLRNRPDLFAGGRVRNEDAYVQEVARVLRTRGLCAAQGGPKDEVAVKSTNEWNDQYDIVLGSGEPWTSYQVTCRPARF